MNITRNIKKFQKQNFQTYQIHNNRTFNISLDYNVETLYQILSKNPKLINIKDNKGETLLSYSIERNKIDIFNLILTSPILDLNYQNKEGNTYLHIAIQFEREIMVKELIEKGINLNIQNNDGNTPIMLVALNNPDENVRLLQKLLSLNPIIEGIVNNKGQSFYSILGEDAIKNHFGGKGINIDEENKKVIKKIENNNNNISFDFQNGFLFFVLPIFILIISKLVK
jgi:ankyrin repeat protein